MELRQLRHWVNVVQTGSFTAAAARQGVAQPAVSMAIRNLEKQLGVTLLDRNEKYIRPTPEGQQLLPHALRMLQEAAAAEEALAELQGLNRGEVSLGLPSMLGSYFFPPILMAFKHRYPDLKMTVQEAGTRRLQQMLRQGELNVGVIVADQVEEDLESQLFLREEMVVCVPKDHPLAQQPHVSFETFFTHDLVLFKTGYFHREFIEQIARQVGASPRIDFESNLIQLTKSIIRHGFGITVFLRMVIEGDDDLVAVPFSEPVYLDLSIAWKRDGHRSLANRAFVDFLLQNSPLRHSIDHTINPTTVHTQPFTQTHSHTPSR